MEISRREALLTTSAAAASGLTLGMGTAPAAVGPAEAAALSQGNPVRRATRALSQDYLRAYKGDGRYAMQYMLADLMHFADNYRLDFDDMLDAATRNFRTDKEVEAWRAGQSWPAERKIVTEYPLGDYRDPLVVRALDAYNLLGAFVSPVQLHQVYELAKEENGQHIVEKLIGWAELIENMPCLSQQRYKFEDAVACLHYSAGDEHWYVLERNAKPYLWDAYAINDIGDGMPWRGMVNLGYVLCEGADFDFDFAPRPLSEIIPSFADFLGRDAPRRAWPAERLERVRRWVGHAGSNKP